MNLFLIFLLFMVVIPYIGGVILAFFSRHYKNHYQVSESYVIGFSIGQLLLLKAFTILGYLQLIDFDNTILVLVVFLLLTIFLDWSDDWYIARRCLKKAVDCRYLKFKQPVWLASIFIFILLLSMLVDVTPPRHADMLRYHLEYSNYIFNSKSLPFVPHYVLALSTDAELLFSMIIMWFGSSYVKLVVYVNLLFCIYAASIYFESSKDRVKKYAIGFFVASPILFLASTIVKPDTIQLLYFIVSLLLINKLFQKFSFTSLILIAIFLGEIVSLKWTGVIPVLSLTIYLIFLFLIKAENRKTLLYLIVAIGVATIIIPMYWYVRNYLATGNPIWPILNHLFVVNDHSLLYEVTTHGSSRSGEIAEYGFLGYLFYTFFIYKPSLLGGLGVSYYLSLPLAIYKSTDKKIIYNFVFVIIYIIVWYFAQASFRHLIWLLPFIAVIASYGYIRSKTWRYGILKYANKVVILLVIFQLVFIAIYSTFLLSTLLEL
jgi:hypothetical protein